MDRKTRLEHDSMGPVELPESALYGPQTQRAVDNFTISDQKMPKGFIQAMLMIKKAAAEANRELGHLEAVKARAIINAIEDLEGGDFMVHFPVPVLQTGSGTSTNMNVNEVVARLGSSEGLELSANDDVNMGQSSNDVIPSALHIAAALQVQAEVIPGLTTLSETIDETARKYSDVVKTGRTHLMDALPIRLEHELGGWRSQIDDNIVRLQESLVRLRKLALGGTAVGSGVNCVHGFPEKAVQVISRISGQTFSLSESFYKGLSSIDTALETSGHLKTCAVSLMKIANDLRWMNSGPYSGLAEIRLQPLQPGSSIMVDKVNPVIPEAVIMAAARVIGNDASITVAAQSGNFQLNTMLPLTAADLLNSGELIGRASRSLALKAIATMTVLVDNLERPLLKNPVLVTSLTPYIGYMKAAQIAKMARREGQPVIEIVRRETDLDNELVDKLLDPRYLADGGKD